jgi:hypothetical protein
MWLEKGQLRDGSLNPYKYDTRGSGWEHIKNNHIANPTGNQFVKKYGQIYTDEEKIKSLILDTSKKGDEVVNSKGIM